ncbi:MAG: diheme cytochrome c-553 [SAR324 cluster bacterium]|nr:diheme cytochrome c-553 [SAR324 cluster bacterium]MCZ6842634.1 diheme cytochrome c-553 [SAR324 cluster bacterium]
MIYKLWGVVFALVLFAGFTNDASAQSPAERGKYLVTIGGCNDCHTPFKMGPKGPHPDMSRLLSGHPENLKMPPAPELPPGPWIWIGAGTNTAFAGPWGISYSANLTPHNSGIGDWSEEMFIKALRTGKHLGVGRPIMPPMPWLNYAAMTDADLKAVFAFLKSIPPIANNPPPYAPPK